jgi:subtilisin family serine protease
MSRKLLCALAAAALVASPVSAPRAHAEPTDLTVPAATEYLGAITLITGDQVSLRRVGTALVPAVTPAPGRESVHFATTAADGGLHVVPSDAWAGLNAGTLDRRLFDVATLLRDGYGDDRRADLPLITGSALDADAEARGKGEMAALWADRDREPIWLDGLRRPSLDHTAAQIGAPSAWKAGYTGKGVTVAVLDTGVDPAHPDLRRRVAASRGFVDDQSTRDTNGHGTHVAATIAGGDERYRGIAPDARLIIGKVCHAGGCPESAILAGMRWAVESGAKIVNLSLGGPDAQGADLLEQAVDQLSARYGTLFVVAAGNDGGYGEQTVSSPASADAALAVGAVDRSDAVAGFSARGPRVGDSAIKPEIVAPGVDVVAARSRLAAGTGRHAALSGTSMATPHVAGAAALLAQRHPGWSGRQLKSALMGTAHPLAENVYDQGAGRVDADRALGAAITADPPALAFGRPRHDDPRPVTRTVVYRNPTDAAVPLALSTSGPFTASSEEISVPARGSASVEVTAGAGEGRLSGLLTAQGPSTITTPLGIDREPESYDLTIRTVDTTGTPTDATVAFLFGGPDSRYRPIPTINGSGTVRVPRGTYHVDAAISTPRPDGLSNSHKVVHPTVDVTADTTLVLDARTARPITISIDAPNTTPKAVGVGYTRDTDTRSLITGVLGDDFARIHIGQSGESAPEIITNIGGAWTAPDNHAYHLAWFDYGPVPTGFTKHVPSTDLATVHATYREQDPRHTGAKLWIAREPRHDTALGFGLPFPLPATRTEHHNPADLIWSAEFHHIHKKETTHTSIGGPLDHAAGGTYRESWNTAAATPSLAGGDWASRFADTISLSIPLFGDSANDRFSLTTPDYGRTILTTDTTLLGETRDPGQGQFEVPPEPTRYRLETTATRHSTYSPLITAVWEFTSQRPEEDPKPLGKEGFGLPITTIRFAPRDLDLHNRARTTKSLIDITLQPNTGADPSPLAGLAVEASVDEGRTWTPVRVAVTGPYTALATVGHPPRGTVSLRATATDESGSRTELTVLRAYGT